MRHLGLSEGAGASRRVRQGEKAQDRAEPAHPWDQYAIGDGSCHAAAGVRSGARACRTRGSSTPNAPDCLVSGLSRQFPLPHANGGEGRGEEELSVIKATEPAALSLHPKKPLNELLQKIWQPILFARTRRTSLTTSMSTTIESGSIRLWAIEALSSSSHPVSL